MYVLCAKSTHFRAFINHNKNYNKRFVRSKFEGRWMEARLKVKIKYFPSLPGFSIVCRKRINSHQIRNCMEEMYKL